MGKYTITSGVIVLPQKVVIYGPEGIGKSTFASKFPDPVFIDTEGGSAKLPVHRLPKPTSWAMLMDEVETVRHGDIPCKTIVIDTADWAERLCTRAVCAAHKWAGVEDPGYGKGYTYVRDEFGKLLDLLEDVKTGGRNVVITAHAQITKFELPDEMGQYDRWSMKTSKQVAPLLREWCDMLLFANYKTFVVKDGDGKNARGKAQGGQRVMYTAHHACWDAKNRDGLPEECPFDYSVIAPHIPAGNAVELPQSDILESPHVEKAECAAPKPSGTNTRPATETRTVGTTAAQPSATVAAANASNDIPLSKILVDLGVPDDLRALMVHNNVTSEQVQQAVHLRGCYPEDMPIRDYDPDFRANLVAKWAQWFAFIQENCDVPF